MESFLFCFLKVNKINFFLVIFFSRRIFYFLFVRYFNYNKFLFFPWVKIKSINFICCEQILLTFSNYLFNRNYSSTIEFKSFFSVISCSTIAINFFSVIVFSFFYLSLNSDKCCSYLPFFIALFR